VLAAESDAAPEDVLDPIGLLLRDPSSPEWGRYESTPRNAVTFAGTGGDGVHYSVVEGVVGARPVVMTVPMNWDNENLVVGEDLVDFLALGSRCGYFVLEQLTYSLETSIRDIESGELGVEPEGVELLDRLRTHFGVRPWPSIGSRLTDLEARYRHLLDLGPG
jgi:hypothetical protein